MVTYPVLLLLVFNLLFFLAAIFLSGQAARRREALLICALFFCSGMPALVYQIVWERVLFAIYGVNAQSVAVVVSAFMLGLGLGALLGGWLSARFPRQGLLLFGAAELGTALFGLFSLGIFHWAARYTAGASLPYTILFSLLLLVIPTMLMGATLPLLVEHLVRFSGRVGFSVATLYFVNTFGSAVASYLCAVFLLRDFGQAGSVALAACLNTLVGITAYRYGRRKQAEKPTAVARSLPDSGVQAAAPQPQSNNVATSLPMGALIAGISGFISLGFEIAWFRVYSLASSNRAPAFALLLATFLAGIAAGSFVAEKLLDHRSSSTVLCSIGMLLVVAGGISAYLPPLVATFMGHKIPFLASAPVFFITAALTGAVLPLVCQIAVSAGDDAGRGVSLVYLANILGSVLGSLGVGFVLMNFMGLEQISLFLGFAAVITGAAVLLFGRGKLVRPPAWVIAMIVLALAAVPVSSRFYELLFERLIFEARPESRVPFAHIVQNRFGTITITKDGAVFGEGVYDGYFNTDPIHDINFVVRPFALSAFVAHPRHVFMLGLSSGSWAQIIANNPDVESLDIVEINPGYLKLIPQYAEVRSLLHNPKVHIYIDDARRWLVAHSEKRYDAIVANGSFYWRDHSSYILSVEFLRIIRAHLNPGGVYYYNTTESNDALATGLSVFPYALRVINFLAVSDSPIVMDKKRWLAVLLEYKIDGRPEFPAGNPQAQRVLDAYMALADSLDYPPRFMGMESGESLRARLRDSYIYTDDNMGAEWRSSNVRINWH